MLLKLMDRAGGGFRVIEVVDCSFHRQPEPHALCEQGTDRETRIAIHDRAFLMNGDGRTIESFFVTGRQEDRKTGT